MQTELIETRLQKQAILYSVTQATIQTMRERFSSLKIVDLNDKSGYEQVHKARMECVKARSEIEKTRKQLKAESLEYGRMVDSEAKQLTTAIEEIESQLASQQKRIDDEKQLIEQRKQDAIVAERIEKLKPYPQTIRSDAVIRSMSNAEFEGYLQEAIEADKARIERERIAAEQAEAKRIEDERIAAELAERKRIQAIEFERMAAEKAELDRQRKEQEAKEAALRAESERLATIERERQERELFEKAKAEAAERKRIEDESAANRAEELKPVKQKIFEFAVYVRDLELPDVGDTEKKLITNILDIAGRAIHDVGKGLK